MKVAIIGAGISGMSCAHELKMHGIVPTIFEHRSSTGDAIDFQSIIFRMYNFEFFGNPIKHLKKHYNLDISPQYHIKELVTVSPNGKTYTTKGNLGFILKRGLDSDSVENQIAKSVDLPIQFDTHINVKDIISDYDRIVVATGTNSIAKELNIFQTTLITHTRVATILGDFKTDSITLWWAREYTNNTYAYLVPYNSKSARLVLIVNGITHSELGYYWETFLKMENFKYVVTETRDVEHNIGLTSPVQLGNIYFVGAAGGLVDDMFGFAAINSMISGVTAARAIVNNENYDSIIHSLKSDMKKVHEFRTMLNTWDNNIFNRVLDVRDWPVIEQSMYNNPFFKITHLTFLARMQNYIWRKTKYPR